MQVQYSGNTSPCQGDITGSNPVTCSSQDASAIFENFKNNVMLTKTSGVGSQQYPRLVILIQKGMMAYA